MVVIPFSQLSQQLIKLFIKVFFLTSVLVGACNCTILMFIGLLCIWNSSIQKKEQNVRGLFRFLWKQLFQLPILMFPTSRYHLIILHFREQHYKYFLLQVMPLENNMRTPQHFTGLCGVLNQGMSGVTLVYMLLGFFGYLKYGKEVQGSVTLNLPIEA